MLDPKLVDPGSTLIHVGAYGPKWLIIFYAPGSTLIEALRFRQEGHPKLKYYSALIKSIVAKYGGVVDSHATSNPAISKHTNIYLQQW